MNVSSKLMALALCLPFTAAAQVQRGDSYTFDVKCGGALPMSGTGRLRQGPGAFEGDLDLAVDSGGGANIGMRTKVSGRRLGPC